MSIEFGILPADKEEFQLIKKIFRNAGVNVFKRFNTESQIEDLGKSLNPDDPPGTRVLNVKFRNVEASMIRAANSDFIGEVINELEKQEIDTSRVIQGAHPLPEFDSRDRAFFSQFS